MVTEVWAGDRPVRQRDPVLAAAALERGAVKLGSIIHEDFLR
jgi:hypothetical protein